MLWTKTMQERYNTVLSNSNRNQKTYFKTPKN